MNRHLSAAAIISVLLTGCGSSAKDLTLGDSNIPEKAKIILEGTTPEERALLGRYVQAHAASLDYKVTIGAAIKAQKDQDAIKAKIESQIH